MRWALLAAGLIPAEKLQSGLVVATSVENPEQRGRGESARSEVEAEIHQGVELALGERNPDQSLDRLLGIADIGSENLGGLGLVDSVRERRRVDEPVAVANGWKAGHIEIGPAAKTFLLLDQMQTLRAEFHQLLLSNYPD